MTRSAVVDAERVVAQAELRLCYAEAVGYLEGCLLAASEASQKVSATFGPAGLIDMSWAELATRVGRRDRLNETKLDVWRREVRERGLVRWNEGDIQ